MLEAATRTITGVLPVADVPVWALRPSFSDSASVVLLLFYFWQGLAGVSYSPRVVLHNCTCVL